MDSSARALVRCADAGVTYGSGRRAIVAVYAANCSVEPRSTVAVTGPSGSGKSTLLYLLAGLEMPTVGTVTWPALDGSPRDPGRVGLVFQAPTLIPSLTVSENVELPLLLADVSGSEARRRAHDALGVLGVRDLRDNLPQQLSGGQAQRVVIARVLAARPRIILADEPTSQLDRATADHVADLLVSVSSELGAALVVATHDPGISGRMDQEWPIRDGHLQPGTLASRT